MVPSPASPKPFFTLGTARPRTTGRFIVVLREGASKEAIKVLKKRIGVASVASTSDFKAADYSPEKVEGAAIVVFEKLGVAVVDAPSEVRSAMASEAATVQIIVPEPIFYIAGGPARLTGGGSPAPVPEESAAEYDLQWLGGYRDAVNDLADRLLGSVEIARRPGAARRRFRAPDFDESRVTWGLQATGVHLSSFTGQGVRVAVLDTGFDFGHPDFAGRAIISQSFIPNENADDVVGHGTHCVGTSCGPTNPSTGPRYGVASQAEIYVGKVLNNAAGSSVGSSVLFGMDWALTNGCQIISMSLSGSVSVGEEANLAFEEIGRRALDADCLMVAAAGNEFRDPVGSPANANTIVAVSAIDRQMRLADFSNIGVNPGGGDIDVTGPGVDIYSSVPMAQGRYDRFNGTSMATPHVAGISALHCQATGAKGRALWTRLTQTARRLPLSAIEVGTGLVQAP